MSHSDAYGPDFFHNQGWWRDEILADWLERATSARPAGAAIVTRAGAVDFGDLSGRVGRFAAALQRQGIARGDVVAVHLPNIPEFLIAWLAINALGAVMQTIHLPYGPREIEHLLRHSGAKAAIALGAGKTPSRAEELLRLAGGIPSLRNVIAVAGTIAGAEDFARLEAEAGQAGIRAKADEPFLLLYTSGTTSVPKAVSVTFNHFLSNARLAAGQFGLRQEDRILCLAPYTHLYGLYTLQLGLCVGATACMVPAFTPPDFIAALRTMQPTVLFGAPGHIAACMQQRLFQDVDLSAVRIVVLSGTTVPPALSTAFEHMLPNGRVMQAWGMTELQFGACGRPSDPREVRVGSVGRAMPGTELRIAGADGRVLAAGETGELQVRGCSVFSGYVGQAATSGETFTADGWFRTGDLAEMDADGNVRLHGRSKDIINRGGVKFNPADVEGIIAAHPAVAQVAIAPVPDVILGERAACFVVLNEGATLGFEELTAYLAEQKVAKFMWPEQLDIVMEMPMTPTRKVIKPKLVRLLLAQTGMQGRPAA
jgi:cyclohexanecarboxylate-CoA ligase